MLSFGESKLDVVKQVKIELGLSLTDEKQLVERAPVKLVENMSRDRAEIFRNALASAGAEVELR